MSPKMSKTWEGSMDEDLEKELELEALELVEECARHVIDYEKAKNSKARQTALMEVFEISIPLKGLLPCYLVKK
jgi:hypothetical protein